MTRIFGDFALALHERGLAVLPTAGKRPLVGGFSHWRRPPSKQAVVEWQQKFPDANVGYHAGHSGLVIVDIDEADAVDNCYRFFGATPGRVKTRRGEHALYRSPSVSIPNGINLRACGLNADLKYGFGGQAIVIAPPSEHPDGGDYSWLGCDPNVLADLPLFDISRLDRLLSSPKSQRDQKVRANMRDGSRKQWLNDQLCAHAASCDDFDALLDVARTLNEKLHDQGIMPLDDSIVVRRAQKVWADIEAGKIAEWQRAPGIVKFSSDDLERLERLDPLSAPNAVTLLMHLRLEHSARCQRGETFSVTPKAMAQNRVIPGWTRERYEKSRDLLLKSGLIERISPMTSKNGMRIAAQYRFPLAQARGRS